MYSDGIVTIYSVRNRVSGSEVTRRLGQIGGVKILSRFQLCSVLVSRGGWSASENVGNFPGLRWGNLIVLLSQRLVVAGLETKRFPHFVAFQNFLTRFRSNTAVLGATPPLIRILPPSMDSGITCLVG